MMMLNSHFRFFAVLLSFLASSPILASNHAAPADQQQIEQIGNRQLSIPKYMVKTCLADGVGKPCTANTSLKTVSGLRVTQQEAEQNCEETEGQRGSVTYTDLILPTNSSPDKVLLVEVTTSVPGQDSSNGFFVRPTRLTRYWGKATVSSKKASFYLAETGQVRKNECTEKVSKKTAIQKETYVIRNYRKKEFSQLSSPLSQIFFLITILKFSVEFASDSIWKNKQDVATFDALMLFVNPEIIIPENNMITVSPNSEEISENLGPNKSYVFKADINYDWGADHVFKVHDNTNVYFEKGAYVRARIVQTEKKVKNILLKGFGTLDVHYDLDADVIGISDDATRQVCRNLFIFIVGVIQSHSIQSAQPFFIEL